MAFVTNILGEAELINDTRIYCFGPWRHSRVMLYTTVLFFLSCNFYFCFASASQHPHIPCELDAHSGIIALGYIVFPLYAIGFTLLEENWGSSAESNCSRMIFTLNAKI